MQSVLVSHSNPKTAQDIKGFLVPQFQVQLTSSLESCLALFEKRRFDYTFIDLDLLLEQAGQLDTGSQKKILKSFWRIFPNAPIIIVAPQEKTREAVKLVKAGANDYLSTPIVENELLHILESTYESNRIQHELDYLRDQFWQDDSLDIIKTNSELMRKTYDKIKYIASTKTTVLLTGETGVGKGVLARLIHQHSDRRAHPFIHVHCGAIPENLVESELFGHEKGAFTGAIKRKLGRFEIAAKGTIFLDEIGTVTSSTQIKLLQVLQDKIFQRVGGEIDVNSEARVITATNFDLKKLTESGDFRADLYYRLNVFPIEIPPLRERKEDIPLLSVYFLDNLNSTYQKEITELHPLVMEAFQEYEWPGNIREFENLIERAYILERSAVLTPESFPQEMFKLDKSEEKIMLDTTTTLAEVRRLGIEQIERRYLKEQMAIHNGRINKTAEAAGISTRQLHKLLSKYKISKEEFRASPGNRNRNQ